MFDGIQTTEDHDEALAGYRLKICLGCSVNVILLIEILKTLNDQYCYIMELFYLKTLHKLAHKARIEILSSKNILV